MAAIASQAALRRVAPPSVFLKSPSRDFIFFAAWNSSSFSFQQKSGIAFASGSSRSGVEEVEITRPDDWHLHVRDGEAMESVVHYSAGVFKRAIIMPNLRPPVTTTAQAAAYRERLLTALRKKTSTAGEQGGGELGGEGASHGFQPLMTLYLTDSTPPEEVLRAKSSSIVYGFKLYPAGATTNSDAGVTDLFGRCLPTLQAMADTGMPLLVHGEVTDAEVDVFDREKVFIYRVLVPLLSRLPTLKVVMEHVTTKDAVEFVLSGPEGRIAATVTPQHLLLNRNAIFEGGLRPHHYCLPVLKREIHRQAILEAVASGSRRFFLGTDSAPHEKQTKEASCGCAGIFSAISAIPLYLHAFEEAQALDKFEAFAAFNGPDFYGLPRNEEKLRVRRKEWKVPEDVSYGSGGGRLVPLLAGKELQWQVTPVDGANPPEI